MTKVSAPYLYRKRGVYYLQKRIPKPLIPQYGRSILQRSLRTGDRAEAVPLLCPRCHIHTGCSANSASVALNKWMKLFVPDGSIIHSFRHSLRDRL